MWHFTPFVVSVNGLLGKEAQCHIQTLAGRLADMSIDIVHATHMCLWGSQIPTSQLSHQPLWGVAQDLDSFLQSASLLPSQRWPSYSTTSTNSFSPANILIIYSALSFLLPYFLPLSFTEN